MDSKRSVLLSLLLCNLNPGLELSFLFIYFQIDLNSPLSQSPPSTVVVVCLATPLEEQDVLSCPEGDGRK